MGLFKSKARRYAPPPAKPGWYWRPGSPPGELRWWNGEWWTDQAQSPSAETTPARTNRGSR